ncbi:MAG: InlB B-repeat-containing protein [Bacillus subtilis]|nr:InlB B-repeat-containing protein [Bacillus subtilis]
MAAAPIGSITQNYGIAVTQPADPTKTGYTFAGWYSDAGLTSAYTFNTMPGQNFTLYAKWTINSYTISFNVNGGSAVTSIRRTTRRRSVRRRIRRRRATPLPDGIRMPD